MPFLRIAPDNTVTVISKHLEAGQGVWTGLSAIVAEELDASWDQMRVESATGQSPPVPATLPSFPWGRASSSPGVSTAVANSWQQLREAGATARAMLVAAAARQWGVPASHINVSQGVISHTGAGRKATFGELAGSAAKQSVPTQVKLKDPGAFTIVGNQKLPRLDARAKSTGKQPVCDRRHAARDDDCGGHAAAALRGQSELVRCQQGQGRPGRGRRGADTARRGGRGTATCGRPRKGREALSVTWDESGAEKRGTAELMKEYRTLGARQGGGDGRGRWATSKRHWRMRPSAWRGSFEFPYLAHAPMEPLTAVCSLSADKCEIWAGCQFPDPGPGERSCGRGLKPEQVTINTLAAGGTFGRRATPGIGLHFRGGFDRQGDRREISGATHLDARGRHQPGGRYRPLNYHHITAAVGKDGKVACPRQRVRRPVDPHRIRPFEAMIGQERRDPTAAGGSARAVRSRRCTR